MKTLITFIYVCLFSVCNGQLRTEIEALRKETGITSQQVLKLVRIDTVYLEEMEDTKADAESLKNSPANIQLQHISSLLRRLCAYKELLNPEQYQKLKQLRFDIYRHKGWMASFYKKNKRPATEQMVEKRMQEINCEGYGK